MKLLANENFPLRSIQYLKSKNFDILSIGIDNPSISDETVIGIATQEGRTILTFDKDYGELIFKHNLKPPEDVIFLRLEEFSPIMPGYIIEMLLRKNDLVFSNALTVISKNSIRQRKY